MKPVTRESLEKRKAIIIADLLSKVEAEDWHGVQDCASDIREIEAQIPLIESITATVGPVRPTPRDAEDDRRRVDPTL